MSGEYNKNNVAALGVEKIEFSSLKCAVCNTGPMISVFQSDQIELLKTLYDKIYIPASELPEYEKHGAYALIKALIDSGFVVVYNLTDAEKDIAIKLSEEIANQTFTKDKEPQNHYPEAEAMVLMQRENLGAIEILLDELAARYVAKKYGISVVGFPGILVRACKKGLITPEEVKDILLKCQRQGTHYSNHFIETVYNSLRR